MSPAQSQLWDRLRMRQVGGWKFRRQHPIGPYFVDFYCPAARLVVQIVSSAREPSPVWADDKSRTAALTANGYRVVEIPSEDVAADLDGVVDAIDRELDALGISSPPRVRRDVIVKPSRPLGEPYERQRHGPRE
jgi:very-short-patch-repair endonuclease